MQIDPIKPMLKAPGTKRLKLKYDEPLSNAAFNVNLRRYIEAPARGIAVDESQLSQVFYRHAASLVGPAASVDAHMAAQTALLLQIQARCSFTTTTRPTLKLDSPCCMRTYAHSASRCVYKSCFDLGSSACSP